MLHWKQLLHLTDEQLTTYDVAEVNLVCAAELPGAEKIDHIECIDRLNHYAHCVHHFTTRRRDGFLAEPAVYNRSESVFRVTCLMTLLWRHFGIRYNPTKRNGHVAFDTADTFIHGAVLGSGGTCATLPVVYVAVGRRLDYPLKLVACAKHLFARWEEAGGERFNIEINESGTSIHQDDHYRQGRYAVSSEIEKRFCFLRSLTPRTELAHFLAQRGHLWLDAGRHQEALEAFTWAARLSPANEGYQSCVKAAWKHWEK